MRTFLFVLLLALGCESATAMPEPRPAAQCSPECSPGGPPHPDGDESDSICYDGCNWCECTSEGPMNCTARLCDGVGDGGA